MVLPYLKGSSFYIHVLFMVNILVYLEFKGLFLNFYGGFSLTTLEFYYKRCQRFFLGTK
jgi:hypothetical protein